MAEWRSNQPQPVTGVLLVGGASRRFGSAKALAQFRGQSLAARAWDKFDWCDERIAVGRLADALPLPFPLTDDNNEVRAPLAGLVAGLRAARNNLCIVLAVDLPCVTRELLQDLAAACSGSDAAIPQTGPLPGAYRRSCLPNPGETALLRRRLDPRCTAKTPHDQYQLRPATAPQCQYSGGATGTRPRLGVETSGARYVDGEVTADPLVNLIGFAALTLGGSLGGHDRLRGPRLIVSK